MGLFHAVSETYGDFGQKTQCFLPSVFIPFVEGLNLTAGILQCRVGSKKTNQMVSFFIPNQIGGKFDDVYNCFDVIAALDRQTE